MRLFQCPVKFDNSTIIQQEDTFWISCPKDGNNIDIYQRPETFISQGSPNFRSYVQPLLPVLRPTPTSGRSSGWIVGPFDFLILNVSVGLIFLSSILQRWGVYLFDMAVTQLFQVTVDNNERNRVAAGQFRSGCHQKFPKK